MENENNVPAPKSNKTPLLIAATVVVVVVIAIVAFLMSKGSNNISDEALEAQTGTQESQNQKNENINPTGVMTKASYKDGKYEAVGNYVSPGGEESIDVTLTLKDGIVSEANVVSNATRPTSKQMQASFIGGYKELVVGKSIDEIQLSKVAASSLAPKGFNDAVEKIKNQAKS